MSLWNAVRPKGFVMKSTRDRGGKMPCRLVVEMIQRLEHHALWKRYLDAGTAWPVKGMERGQGEVKLAINVYKRTAEVEVG